jgi:hypothetical protein|tara:strand:- start:549 stop:803 length:255 start_codon:yes stop_codon:yes gene_type:complete
MDVEFKKQFGNLDRYKQLDGTIIGSKIDVHVAVLLDEIDHAVARRDHYTVKMLERRIRDVKIVPRKERSVNGVATTASMITPDN